MGENIAMTTNAGQKEPITAVLQWLASGPHCASIFSTSFTHIGVGSWGRYWTQNFLRMSGSTDNPLYDGTHYSHSTHTKGKLRFLVSFKSSAAPQSMKVVVNGVERPMSLHLGRATQGLYSFEQANPSATAGCLSYHFLARTSTGSTYRMPETGAFQTDNFGSCTTNWIFSSNTGSGTAPAPSPPTGAAPNNSPSRLPTKQPTRAPSRVPTGRPFNPSPSTPTSLNPSTPVPPRPSRPTGGWGWPPKVTAEEKKEMKSWPPMTEGKKMEGEEGEW
eukprot:evm.model.NODE_16910_length_7702_cov_62.435989.2